MPVIENQLKAAGVDFCCCSRRTWTLESGDDKGSIRWELFFATNHRTKPNIFSSFVLQLLLHILRRKLISGYKSDSYIEFPPPPVRQMLSLHYAVHLGYHVGGSHQFSLFHFPSGCDIERRRGGKIVKNMRFRDKCRRRSSTLQPDGNRLVGV